MSTGSRYSSLKRAIAMCSLLRRNADEVLRGPNLKVHTLKFGRAHRFAPTVVKLFAASAVSPEGVPVR
jgi:hypothetical protein